MGKYIITPNVKYKLDIYNSLDSDKDKYVEFIYDFDKEGNPIQFTCDEEKLANYFGKNPEKPQYVTPIYFTKDVLKKYYENPNKYTVDDGYVRCEGVWLLRIDNSCKNYVVAFLGDLGKLSYKEQLYWKSFNIEKQNGLSYTGFSRAFLGEPANPESLDLYFKMIYRIFCENTYKKNGWSFFKPLEKDDLHYFSSLHVLTNQDNEKEFDNQILSLTKVLIDSLNEKELSKFIEVEPNDKGIDKLEKYLSYKKSLYTDLISFLRNLQDLRSTTVAHRRSDSNKKRTKCEEYFEISTKSLSEVMDSIFEKAVWTINTLQKIEGTST